MTMPNFLIIGAAKAGTTALYRYLNEHPQIYMSPKKEPQFFALEGEKADFQGPGDGIKYTYITEFEAYCELFDNVVNELAIGEASPWYLYEPKAPERIQHYIPNAKLIAILRDPVERAYSNFLNSVREDLEPLNDFVQAMEAESERINSNWSPRWFYKQRGFYYIQLKRYFDQFDRNQLKVYLYEDLQSDPIGLMQDIFQFLGVDETFVPDTSQKHNVSLIPRNKVLNKLFRQPNSIKSILKPFLPSRLRKQVKTNLINLNLQKKPQLQPEVRKQLIEEYREDILKLQELIQRDLSRWLKV